MVFIGAVFLNTIQTCSKRLGHGGYERVQIEMRRCTEDMSKHTHCKHLVKSSLGTCGWPKTTWPSFVITLCISSIIVFKVNTNLSNLWGMALAMSAGVGGCTYLHPWPADWNSCPIQNSSKGKVKQLGLLHYVIYSDQTHPNDKQ